MKQNLIDEFNSQEEVNVSEFFNKIRLLINHLKKKLVFIIFSLILGAGAGVVFYYFQNTTYTAQTTFIVEEVKGNTSLGGLASLAGQFGVDVGSASSGGGSGVIAGDNILLYLKSENLIREVLLSNYDSTSNLSYADIYASKHKLLQKWNKDNSIGNVKFDRNLIKESPQKRLLDSLLQVLIRDNILRNQIDVFKIDKKAGFIKLKITTNDELFSKKFNDRLLEVAISNYISLKTRRQQKTVEKLQKRADSIEQLLIKKTTTTALLQTVSTTMDVNPLFKTDNSIKSEINSRDKTMISTVYGEVIKNLELAKFSLSQETPVIQVVDDSYLPLVVNKFEAWISILVSSLLFSVIYCIFLITKFIFDR